MLIPNQWYAVLETNEVKADKPKGFKRLGRDLVFWRDQAGQVVAMEDRCPHRQVKLSLGKVVDGCIECPFHGFQYDRKGDCQLIPANGKNGPRPKIFQAKSYPVREEHSFIWLWYGEARQEYPAVPFFEELEKFSYSTSRKRWAVHYTRAIENQMDVAHLPFIHANTIGRGSQTLVNGPYTLLKDNTIYVWIDNQVDQQLPALKPDETVIPNRPAELEFKFPNVWMLRPSEQLRVTTSFVPVDDENTLMYVRFYHNFVKNPLARQIIARLGALSNNRVLRQDARVVITHNPKQGGLESGDKYIPADRPLLVYYKQREKLLQAANQPVREVLANNAFAEQQLVG